MDDFWKRAQDSWDDYELFQREIQTEERLQEVADRVGMTVEEVKKVLKRIDNDLRLLRAARPTLEEHSKFLHEHSRKPGER